MPYEIYKILHLVFIFLFISNVTKTFSLRYEDLKKSTKIFTGISSFLIFVAAMGLLARIGVSHRGGWPFWAYLKLVVWLSLSIAVPILNKKIITLEKRKLILNGFLALIIIQVIIIIFKPI